MLKKIFTKDINISFIILFVILMQLFCLITNSRYNSGINNLLLNTIKVIQAIGYFAIIIKWFFDFYKCAKNNNYHSLATVCVNYFVLFVILFALPYQFLYGISLQSFSWIIIGLFLVVDIKLFKFVKGGRNNVEKNIH